MISSETNLPKLEYIPVINVGLRHYLLEYMHVPQETLETSFINWCKNLSEGNGFPDMRRFVVYALLGAEYTQYQISEMLGVSLRTIGRDVRLIAEKKLLMPRFWKRGLLRSGKLRTKKETGWEILEKIAELYLKDDISTNVSL